MPKPKASRQPFIDQTNTLNMNSAKTGKRNTSKIATRTRSAAKKSKATESDKNPIKTTIKSRPNKPKTSVSKSDNLPVCKTRLSRKMSKDNAAGKSPKTTRKPIEKSDSKASLHKPQTSASENDTKSCDNKLKRKCRISDEISKNNTAVKKIKTTQKSTTSINADYRPKVKKGISKIKITEKSLQNEDSQKIILKQLKVDLTGYIPASIPDNQKQKVALDPNLQKNRQQYHLKNQQKIDRQHHSPDISVPSNLNKNIPGVICKKTKSDDIPTQVTSNSNLQKGKERYGLRQRQKVNFKYSDESVLDSTSDLEKNDVGPVYKKTPIWETTIPELLQTEDPFEFIDATPPKAKKLEKKRQDKTKFDKDIYETMQKIEKQEARKKAKAKKRVQTKKKPYCKTIGDILSNVMQKISKKQRNNPLVTKIDDSNIDGVEFINNHVPSTSTNELPSTSTANSLQNVAVRKPQTKFNILSNELVKRGVTEREITKNSIFSEDLPSTNTANSLQDVAVRTPSVPEFTVLNNKLLTASATVPEPESFVNEDLPTKNTDQRIKQVPKNSVAFLSKELPTTSTPNRTSKLCNTSLNATDINSCFGFDDDDYLLPVANSPNPLDDTLGSPLKFDAKKPNANSTMIGVEYNSRPSRAEGPRLSYFNCKDNGLPSGNQRIFIDHTIAEAFECTPSKTPLREETPAKRPAVQQSILDYVDHNDHPTCQNKMLEVSLFNIEELQSPKKKKTPRETHIENVNVNLAKRNIQFPTVSSIKRKPLGDISNSSDDTTFYRSDGSPRKSSKNNNISDENAKPCRFNPNLQKVYTKKKSNNQSQKEPEVNNEATAQQTSISIMETSDENLDEVELFEDPEKLLEDMASEEINLKKSKRKRHIISGESNCEQKRQAKKTKLDPEAETWIQQFNDKCQEIQNHQLELE